MQHKEEVKQWINLADNDLALAEHTSKTMWPVPHEIVCFHCQQFAEKYLKAFLVSKGQEPPYIHDLVYNPVIPVICKLLKKICSEL